MMSVLQRPGKLSDFTPPDLFHFKTCSLQPQLTLTEVTPHDAVYQTSNNSLCRTKELQYIPASFTYAAVLSRLWCVNCWSSPFKFEKISLSLETTDLQQKACRTNCVSVKDVGMYRPGRVECKMLLNCFRGSVGSGDFGAWEMKISWGYASARLEICQDLKNRKFL